MATISPKFPPPPPELDSAFENPRRKIPISRERGPMAKVQNIRLVNGTSSSKLNVAQSSRKLSLLDQEQTKSQEKGKSSSGWR